MKELADGRGSIWTASLPSDPDENILLILFDMADAISTTAEACFATSLGVSEFDIPIGRVRSGR